MDTIEVAAPGAPASPPEAKLDRSQSNEETNGPGRQLWGPLMTAFVIAVALINVASVFLLTTATDAATVRVAAIVAVPAFSSTLLALLMMAVLRAEAKGVAAKLDHDARILEAAARFASTGFGAARGEPDDHVLRDVVTRVCTDMNDLLATLQRHSRQPAPAPPPK